MQLQAGIKKMGITMYSSYAPWKVSMAERFMQTIKHRIWYHFLLKSTHRWVDALPALVDDYNHTRHSSIDMAPSNNRLHKNQAALFERMGKPGRKTKPLYHVS